MCERRRDRGLGSLTGGENEIGERADECVSSDELQMNCMSKGGIINTSRCSVLLIGGE